MSLSILLIHEMRIIGTYQLDTVFLGQFNQYPVGLLLQDEGLAVRPDIRVLHFVALQLQIVVVTEYAVVPLDSLTGPSNVSIQNLCGHLTGNTGRTDDQSFMILLQISTIGSRSHIMTIHPRPAYQLDEVLIALVVLGQDDQVITTHIRLVYLARFITVSGHVHLASEDGFERFLPFFLEFSVHLVASIEELLNAEHITMIGNGHATHAVGDRLVD